MPRWISRHVPNLRNSGYVTLFYSHVVMVCKGTVVLHVDCVIC